MPWPQSLSLSARPSCSPADNTDEKDKPEVSELQEDNILRSSTSCYLTLDTIGEGSFGKVTKCLNMVTSQNVALKILKSEVTAEREIKMLEIVSVLDPVKTNVVQFLETFKHKGQTCLAFEMLDRSLFDLILERHLKPLSLSEIRPIAKQLLTAFDALKGIGVIHSDLKPDNIMLTNHPDEPFRVKLIDFGLSLSTSEVKQGMVVQPLGYRAPEVTLGLPISESIDMWGLSCVLSFLYLGNNPFRENCEYQIMRDIVGILGQPADHVLSAGKNTHKFFKEDLYWDSPKWWLKTPVEYMLDTGITSIRQIRSVRNLGNLLTLQYPERSGSVELQDRRAFVSLLRCLFQTDPERRITPERALTHPFITLAHLKDEMNTSSYMEDSIEHMLVCPDEDMDVEVRSEGEIYEAIEDDVPVSGSAEDESELSPDEESDEWSIGEVLPARPNRNAAGWATPHSYEDVAITLHSNDGAAAAGPRDTIGSAEDESELSPDEESDEWSIGEVLPARPNRNSAGWATPHSYEDVAITLHSNYGAAATGPRDTVGSAEEESAVSQSAFSPAEETTVPDGSPDEGPPVKIKRSRLKRVRKFFGRAIRVLFGRK